MSLADLLGMLGPAVISGAVTWGVVRTELRYLRRDVDAAHTRLDHHERAVHAQPRG